jgi:hypothetical protein
LLQALKIFDTLQARSQKGESMTLKKPGRNIPPVQRLKPWMSVAIRMETYAKLREMSEFYGRGMGDQMQVLVDPAFEIALKAAEEREAIIERGETPPPKPKPKVRLKKGKQVAKHVQVKRPVARKYYL